MHKLAKNWRKKANSAAAPAGGDGADAADGAAGAAAAPAAAPLRIDHERKQTLGIVLSQFKARIAAAGGSPTAAVVRALGDEADDFAADASGAPRTPRAGETLKGPPPLSVHELQLLVTAAPPPAEAAMLRRWKGDAAAQPAIERFALALAACDRVDAKVEMAWNVRIGRLNNYE